MPTRPHQHLPEEPPGPTPNFVLAVVKAIIIALMLDAAWISLIHVVGRILG